MSLVDGRDGRRDWTRDGGGAAVRGARFRRAAAMLMLMAICRFPCRVTDLPLEYGDTSDPSLRSDEREKKLRRRVSVL
jgi:hypothetical protein